jgi:hypothetical protein
MDAADVLTTVTLEHNEVSLGDGEAQVVQEDLVLEADHGVGGLTVLGAHELVVRQLRDGGLLGLLGLNRVLLLLLELLLDLVVRHVVVLLGVVGVDHKGVLLHHLGLEVGLGLGREDVLVASNGGVGGAVDSSLDGELLGTGDIGTGTETGLALGHVEARGQGSQATAG